MPSRILSDEQLKSLVYDLFVNRMFRREVLNKYNIARQTFGSYMKRAVNLGFISKEQRLNWQNNAPARTLEARIKKDGIEKVIDSCKKGWEKGWGKSQQNLIDHGKLGGDITQALHPHVIQNLKSAQQYNPKKCYYNDIKFSSFGERFLALLLLQYGLINKILPGENFQKKIDSKIVDFYINQDLIVEYHPIPKNHPKIKHENEKQYKENRKKELGEYFNGEIVVVTSISNLFKKLPELGIEKDWHTHIEKVREVKSMLFEYDIFNQDNEEDLG